MSTQLEEVATRLTGEAQSALTGEHIPTEAITMLGHIKQSVETVLGARQQLSKDLADLDARQRLLPPTGYKMLEQQALGQARSAKAAAAKVGRAALENLKTELEAAALPSVDPARESLDRDTAMAVIGNSDGGTLGGRLLKLAQDGDPAVVATLLNSPFGEAVLKSRGVHAKTIADARKLAAVSPTRKRSPKEQAAYQLLKSDPNVSNPNVIGKLEGALVAAETSFLQKERGRAETAARIHHGIGD